MDGAIVLQGRWKSADPAVAAIEGGAVLQGWFSKRSVTAPAPFKNWRKRFIVLHPDSVAWHKTAVRLSL